MQAFLLLDDEQAQRDLAVKELGNLRQSNISITRLDLRSFTRPFDPDSIHEDPKPNPDSRDYKELRDIVSMEWPNLQRIDIHGSVPCTIRDELKHIHAQHSCYPLRIQLWATDRWEDPEYKISDGREECDFE